MVRALPQYSEPDFIFKLDIMFLECMMLLAAAYFTFFSFFLLPRALFYSPEPLCPDVGTRRCYRSKRRRQQQCSRSERKGEGESQGKNCSTTAMESSRMNSVCVLVPEASSLLELSSRRSLLISARGTCRYW